MNKVDSASYADADTLYVTWNWVKEVFKSLKEESDELFYWFADHQMKSWQVSFTKKYQWRSEHLCG